MAKKRFYDGDYSGPLNKARRQEARDFGMISEDKSACANLPQHVIQKEWPKPGYYADYDLDDTIRGINEQENADGSGMKRHRSKSKY
jgi:hypothetical protein